MDDLFALKTVKVEVRISEQQKARLKAYAKKHKTTVAMAIRLMVNEKLTREDKTIEQHN